MDATVIIDGYGSTYEAYGFRLAKGTGYAEAEVNDNYVTVPGRDGPLDLTEAIGAISYGSVVDTLVFICTSGDPLEQRRRMVNDLSGKRLQFRYSRDPDYLMTGRWKFSGLSFLGVWPTMTVQVTRDPYKLKETCTYRVNAAGGIMIALESGRMPVCPTFEFASESIVACGDVYAQMQPGSYKVNDLWLHEGINEIYLNSYLGDGNVAAERYQDDTIAMHADKRISDLIWDGIRGAALIIEDWVDDTISIHADERIIDTAHAVSTDTEEFAVYIQYPWKDL